MHSTIFMAAFLDLPLAYNVEYNRQNLTTGKADAWNTHIYTSLYLNPCGYTKTIY